MSFEVKGKLNKIFDTQVVNDKFQKREFVLEIEDGNFTQFIKFQLTQDKCELLDDFQINQEVNCNFSLRGRPFENREGKTIYFNNLNVWRITALVEEGPTLTPMDESPAPQVDMDDDDLPF